MRDQTLAALHFGDQEIGCRSAIEAGASVGGDSLQGDRQLRLNKELAFLVEAAVALEDAAALCVRVESFRSPLQ